VLDAIANFLTSGGIDEFVATHDWAWPLGEILHFFGMALLIGSVGLVDLRMLGVGKGIPIKSLEKFIWLGVIGFIINLLTGIMFVAGNPVGGPQEYLTRRESVAQSGGPSVTVVTLMAGRRFRIHHRPMPDGGWVATHEDLTAGDTPAAAGPTAS
jgi:hypothetical protein